MSADPYAEGADAWLAGEPETANPYDPESDEHLSWNDGWSDAENLEEVADDAVPQHGTSIITIIAQAAEVRRLALEEAAGVASAFGSGRPLVDGRPTERIIGRWEGEQAASGGIAAAIRALIDKPGTEPAPDAKGDL